GVEAELFAEAQQPLLGADRRVRVVPLGAADRAEQDRVGLAAHLERLVGQRGLAAGRVDCGAADVAALVVEGVRAGPGDGVEHRQRRPGDLLPDAIAGQYRDRGLDQERYLVNQEEWKSSATGQEKPGTTSPKSSVSRSARSRLDPSGRWTLIWRVRG